jgi:hypothetical protein
MALSAQRSPCHRSWLLAAPPLPWQAWYLDSDKELHYTGCHKQRAGGVPMKE